MIKKQPSEHVMQLIEYKVVMNHAGNRKNELLKLLQELLKLFLE